MVPSCIKKDETMVLRERLVVKGLCEGRITRCCCGLLTDPRNLSC